MDSQLSNGKVEATRLLSFSVSAICIGFPHQGIAESRMSEVFDSDWKGRPTWRTARSALLLA
jgi:hypothetical protein